MQELDSRRGLTATRYLKSLIVGRGDLSLALNYALHQNWRDTPAVPELIRYPSH